MMNYGLLTDVIKPCRNGKYGGRKRWKNEGAIWEEYRDRHKYDVCYVAALNVRWRCSNMINKKLIVGLFAILVILMTVQSFAPAFATAVDPSPSPNSDGGNNNTGGYLLDSYRVVVNVQGSGKVCWTGALDGCTDGSMSQLDQALYVPVDGTITFTATGSGPIWFIDGQISQGPPAISADGLDHTVTATFAQNLP
jgi:hypothetical protein